uniref:Uncharacterized protein n=1 Tax=Vitis vinifera TaxID=29760 RepID=A5C507_VITVI|nr:hypothetical protein VITISV_001303 [Vitis vinifera]
MTSNLRAGFKERQCKRLFEALLTALPPVKRTRPEVSHEESILDALMAQMALSNTVRSNIDALFPLTHRYFVDLHGDLPITIMPRLSHDTPKTVLQCIYPMQQYTVVETTKVGVVAIRNLMRQRSSLFKQLEKKELEELRAGFAVEKEELKEDYQKQVDEMFFFGYQCYMRKNDITHDTPNYLYDEEDATVSGPAQGDKDSDAVGPFDGQ